MSACKVCGFTKDHRTGCEYVRRLERLYAGTLNCEEDDSPTGRNFMCWFGLHKTKHAFKSRMIGFRSYEHYRCTRCNAEVIK